MPLSPLLCEVVDNCKALWEQKEAECEEHKEEWAGMCSAPQSRLKTAGAGSVGLHS